jgi:para-nitrobenzyl esterase
LIRKKLQFTPPLSRLTGTPAAFAAPTFCFALIMNTRLPTLAYCGLFFSAIAFGEGSVAPTIQTHSGAVAGAFVPKTQILVFRGLPFAAPPVGDLRWREPQPVKPWTGVRDATRFGPSPMQRVHGDFLPWTREYLVQNEVSEDCLYLNVWTPRADASAKLPVLVYIPGGAFTEGSGEVPIYEGTHLAQKGVVLVTINYRLGIFGFFAHPELTRESPHHASGNYGLLDQVAALQWVQTNIAAFGGDPSRVAVWGQSAGAFSVGALLASPLSKGLFQRAIADSGLSVGGSPITDLATAEKRGEQFAQEHHAVSLEKLRALPADELVKAGHFDVTIDGWLLQNQPATIDTQGGGIDVPVLTGYQANDGLLSQAHLHTPQEYAQWAQDQYGPLAAEFEKLYPGNSDEQIQTTLIEVARDRERVAMYLWATEREHAYHSPVYTYFFVRGIPWPQHPSYGAFHSGELPYFFDNLNVLDRPWQKIDHQLADLTPRYLKNFAATGNPNGAQLPEWPAVSDASPSTFQIGEELKTADLTTPAKRDFWMRYFASKEIGKAPAF